MMKYRKLGSTGMNVSVIGLGTWQFGGEWGKDFTQVEVDAMLDKAGELGINLIDTAECYGDHLSEKFIGDYLARRKREDWVVATKFGHHFQGHLQREQLWRAEDVLKQLDDSSAHSKQSILTSINSIPERMSNSIMISCGVCSTDRSKPAKSVIWACRSVHRARGCTRPLRQRMCKQRPYK